jgi:hypothetical protein
MSYPWRPLLARALCALVLIPLLLNYGFGMIAVSGTEPLYLAILVFSLPWVWAVVALVLLCAFGLRWTGRALRFALLGQRPLDTADDLGRIAAALALAARAALAMGLLWWAALTLSSFANLDSQMRGEPGPAPVSRLFSRGVGGYFTAPLGALVIGHLWLGQAAEAARRASGSVSAAPLLGTWAGLTVFVFLAVPVQALLYMFVRFQ